MGITTPEEAIEQMDLPDTERANSLALAALHDIDATIDHMLYGGEDDAETAAVAAGGTATWTLDVTNHGPDPSAAPFTVTSRRRSLR